jgi:DNA-binding transcriptional MerR regulator
MRIGEVAARTGLRPGTIRYYERLRIISAPVRSPAGYRVYSAHAVDEIAFVTQAKTLGFSLEAISEILTLSRKGVAPCDRVISLGEANLRAVEQRIDELQQFRRMLAKAVRQWRGRCGFTPGGFCDLVAPAKARADSRSRVKRT